MRVNLPVVAREYPFPAGETLVSTTDLQGRILYCNPMFVEVSGYAKEELRAEIRKIAPDDLTADVIYQIGALQGLARAAGTSVRYVKPHGALYNAIAHDLAQADAVIAAIKLVGAAYLLWMAWHMWRDAATPLEITDEGGARKARSAWSAFRLGVLTQYSNPKAAVMFSSLFIGTVPPGTNWAVIAALMVFLLFLAIPSDINGSAFVDVRLGGKPQPALIVKPMKQLDGLLADLRAADVEAITKPEWDHPDVGRFARIHDPEGNAIELWEPPTPAA